MNTVTLNAPSKTIARIERVQDLGMAKLACGHPVPAIVPVQVPVKMPATDPAPVPGHVPDFAERHDDPAQAEELERQQDA